MFLHSSAPWGPGSAPAGGAAERPPNPRPSNHTPGIGGPGGQSSQEVQRRPPAEGQESVPAAVPLPGGVGACPFRGAWGVFPNHPSLTPRIGGRRSQSRGADERLLLGELGDVPPTDPLAGGAGARPCRGG